MKNNKLRGRTVLEMDENEAYNFFLKSNSYFSLELPDFYDFSALIKEANNVFNDVKNLPKKINFNDEFNIKLMISKDGFYTWRPMTIINPLLYIDILHHLTHYSLSINNQKIKSWDFLKQKFKEYQKNEKIKCVSIPRESNEDSNKSDLGENILNWWEEFEQKSIKKSLEFSYCMFTDISNFYPSIYTHSITWALFDKEEVKKDINNPKFSFGKGLDEKLMALQQKQTNGIPQGSVLMDFVAEIILGYIDLKVSELLEEQKNYYILRYRDDYRIFANSLDELEKIFNSLQKVLLELNLSFGSSKTFVTNDIITNAIKPDKLYWEPYRISIKSSMKSGHKVSLQKHLLQIYKLSLKFPNCGTLKRALSEFYHDRKSDFGNSLDDLDVLISILVELMYKNQIVIPHCVTILSKLLYLGKKNNKIDKIYANNIIHNIFEKFKTKANTDYVQIWLHRLSIVFNDSIENTFKDYLTLDLIEIVDSQFNKTNEIKKNLFDYGFLDNNHNHNNLLNTVSIINENKYQSMKEKVLDEEMQVLYKSNNYIF